MFQDYFPLPFFLEMGKVYSANKQFCFQFFYPFMHSMFENILIVGENHEKSIVRAINDDATLKSKYLYQFNQETNIVYCERKPLLLIRGWGYLTGQGALNLQEEKATQIQTELGNYITSRLNKNQKLDL